MRYKLEYKLFPLNGGVSSRDKLAAIFKEIKEIHKDIPKVNKKMLDNKTPTNADKATMKLYTKGKERIKELREQAGCYVHLWQRPVLVHGKNKFHPLKWMPLEKDGKSLREAVTQGSKTLRKDIQQKRRKARVVNEEERVFNGFKYTMAGGVFTSANQISDLLESTSQIRRVRQGKKPHPRILENHVGIEIECAVKCDRELLEEKFAEARLGGYVNVKSDGSVRTDRERGTPIEITMMAKQSELKYILERVNKVLRSKAVDARANDSCGLHVHLDMRTRDYKAAYKKLFSAQSVLLNMLPASRRDGNQYCRRNTIDNFDDHARSSDRYFVINTEAYKKYNTLEIRAHSGSTNITKIYNWVQLLIAIVDFATVPTQSFRSINTFSEYYNISAELKDYIVKRTEKFKQNINTTQDEQDVA